MTRQVVMVRLEVVRAAGVCEMILPGCRWAQAAAAMATLHDALTRLLPYACATATVTQGGGIPSKVVLTSRHVEFARFNLS